MQKRHLLNLITGAALAVCGLAHAQDNAFKIALILPMTGPFASTGKQIEAAAKLYMAQNGDTVAVFPEGTTGEGQGLLPFHANLLQAAITTATPVQPVALRYADAQHAVSPAALWVGDTSLVQSLWLLARGQGMEVRLQVLPPMATAHADRRALAEHLREVIGQALRVESGA